MQPMQVRILIYSFPEYQRLMPQANYYYPMKLPDIPKKNSGKLTRSIENIKAIENKEKKKVKEEQCKLERREKGINVVSVCFTNHNNSCLGTTCISSYLVFCTSRS